MTDISVEQDTVQQDTVQRGRASEPRVEKVAVVDEVRQRLSSAGAAILTEYRGLKVSELEALRRSLREAGGEYKIYKNTLVRFAIRDLDIQGIDPLLEGPTAIAFADSDVPGVAKALRDFSRAHPLLVVKGGVMGTGVLSAGDTAALADIPPREVLLARMAGLIAAPLQQFAGLLQALPRNLAYGIKALIDAGATPEGLTAELPASDTAASDTTASDTTVGGTPPADAPTAVIPVTDAPTADAPTAVVPVTDAPPADAPPADTPVTDTTTADALAAGVDQVGDERPGDASEAATEVATEVATTSPAGGTSPEPPPEADAIGAVATAAAADPEPGLETSDPSTTVQHSNEGAQ